MELLLTPLTCVEQLTYGFGVSRDLAERVLRFADFFRATTGHDVEAISGYRTCAQQEALGRRGRPAAPCDISTHTTCPATGMDFRLGGLFDSDFVKLLFGGAAIRAGLRWGGGSPERQTEFGAIPSDWQHLDLGRRSA